MFQRTTCCPGNYADSMHMSDILRQLQESHTTLRQLRSPRTAHDLGWLTPQPLASQTPCWEHLPSLQALLSCLCQQGALLCLPGHQAGLKVGLRPQAARQAGLKGAPQHQALGHLLRGRPLACCWWYLRGASDSKESAVTITGQDSADARSRHCHAAARSSKALEDLLWPQLPQPATADIEACAVAKDTQVHGSAFGA
jgi:hypothetical protein